MTKSFLLCFAVAVGSAPGQSPAPAPTATEAAPVSLNEFSSSLENLVSRVRPSVVQIYSTGYATNEENESTTASLLTKQHSTGSGMILAADGYIVTNAHVVRGARRIQVRLPTRNEIAGRNVSMQPEGKLMDAKLVGLDRDMDVAVVKIEKTGLPFDIWRFEPRSSGRAGDGVWKSAGTGRIGEHGHRQFHFARAPSRRFSGVHPDRRAHQPRQQRRSIN